MARVVSAARAPLVSKGGGFAAQHEEGKAQTRPMNGETKKRQLKRQMTKRQKFIQTQNKYKRLGHSASFVLFVAFLISFHMLLFAAKQETEVYLAKQIKDTFIYNCFDGDHNNMMDVRRIPDFWEWAKNVLVPGLLSNSPGRQNWPDGHGAFANEGGTDYTTDELWDQHNYIDLSAGIQLRQVRAEAVPADDDPFAADSTRPLYAAFSEDGKMSRDTYGVDGAFEWWSEADLGGTTQKSASSVSRNVYPADGFVAYMLPFFSSKEIGPDVESGRIANVTAVSAGDVLGEEKRFCMRTSINGKDLKQVCDYDPNRNVAKSLAEGLITDLKKQHWIDFRTRFVVVTIQMAVPNADLTAKVDLMFEFPAAGCVLPSFQIVVRNESPEAVASCKTQVLLVHLCVAVFILLEALEVYSIGAEYFYGPSSMWNVIDIINIIVWFVSASYLNLGLLSPIEAESSLVQSTVGFTNNWHEYAYYTRAKQLLAVNATLQVLKLSKYLNQLFPRMGLMGEVMSQAAVDLLFFSVTFAISIVAFSDCFYVMLGSNVSGYYSPIVAVLTLVRALFGDFDIDQIDDNSPSPLNGLLFLAYLFVAVFMMLSMFFAILGDAQDVVIAKAEEDKEKGVSQEGKRSVLHASRVWLQDRLATKYPQYIEKYEPPLPPAGPRKGPLDDERDQVRALRVALAQMGGFVQFLNGAKGTPPLAELALWGQKEMRAVYKLQAHFRGKLVRQEAEELQRQQLEAKRLAREEREAKRCMGRGISMLKDSAVHKCITFTNRTDVQMVLYVLFLISFHLLLYSTRQDSEFYLAENIKKIFISNAFDADHNEMMDIRRLPDMWEWNQNAFIPGLFSNSPLGEVWPDGDGAFSQEGASYFSVENLQDQANTLGFHGGIQLRQVRAKPDFSQTDRYGYRPVFGGVAGIGHDEQVDKQPYGYGGIQKNLSGTFRWFSAEELGMPPHGVLSPSTISTKVWPSDGYVAYILPFFSDTLLPTQNGTYTEVEDHRPHTGPANKNPKPYYCVRTSVDGVHISQACEGPGNRTRGVVRRAGEKLMNDLKEGHWIDVQTRFIQITMQVRCANAGLNAYVNLVFEYPETDGVLPSFRVATARNAPPPHTRTYLYTAVLFVVTFIVLEIVEIVVNGWRRYIGDPWNYVDWTNYLIFFVSWSYLESGLLNPQPADSSRISDTVGFSNEWQRSGDFVAAKQWLAINATLQVLKIMKFCNVLVPKMSLLSEVLMQASGDLIFFSVTLVIGIAAFADCFYVMIGANVERFYSLRRSFLSLWRALFGDFDVDEIDDNSPTTLNSWIFITFLFIVVFVLLSMFFAILGNAQGVVIQEHRIKRINKQRRDAFLGKHTVPFKERVMNILKTPFTTMHFNLADAKVSPEMAAEKALQAANRFSRTASVPELLGSLTSFAAQLDDYRHQVGTARGTLSVSVPPSARKDLTAAATERREARRCHPAEAKRGDVVNAVADEQGAFAGPPSAVAAGPPSRSAGGHKAFSGARELSVAPAGPAATATEVRGLESPPTKTTGALAEVAL